MNNHDKNAIIGLAVVVSIFQFINIFVDYHHLQSVANFMVIKTEPRDFNDFPLAFMEVMFLCTMAMVVVVVAGVFAYYLAIMAYCLLSDFGEYITTKIK